MPANAQKKKNVLGKVAKSFQFAGLSGLKNRMVSRGLRTGGAKPRGSGALTAGLPSLAHLGEGAW